LNNLFINRYIKRLAKLEEDILKGQKDLEGLLK
jgi:hypothetical protein